MDLLQVEELSTDYLTQTGYLRAVDSVSMTVRHGEALGLVGESGCGKSSLAHSILRLLPENARIGSGRILFQGSDLTTLSENDIRKVRHEQIGLVPQSAMNALDPVYRVGNQIVEAILAHRSTTARKAWATAEELFNLVGLDPERLRAFPHELSGGMKQRALIAMALCLDPPLLIADEPTTALDVIVQDHILREFKRIHRERELSLIYVSHDISVIAETCDRVAVMYAGRIAELCDITTFFDTPGHPYTMGLQKAFPTIVGSSGQLTSIPGYPPNLINQRLACPFAERCPFVQDICVSEVPPFLELGPDHFAACHFARDAEHNREIAKNSAAWEEVERRQLATRAAEAESAGEMFSGFASEPLTNERDDVQIGELHSKANNESVFCKMENVVKDFALKSGLFRKFIASGKNGQLTAVNDVTLSIYQGETLGLAGESGCGKTTLGEILVRLQSPSAGKITVQGTDVSRFSDREFLPFRRMVQMIFQDPYESLNPRFTIERNVAEPLVSFGIGTVDEREQRVVRALEDVELRPARSFLTRYPHELSGGQRQRVAIARAIILRPAFIVADEPASMLDVSVRAGLLNLLRRLQQEYGLTMLYVSHDLATVKYLSDRIATMYRGRIVEVALAQELPAKSLHPYTKALFSAVPIANPRQERDPVPIRGEMTQSQTTEEGCIFAARCPYAFHRCHESHPALREYEPGHHAACYLLDEAEREVNSSVVSSDPTSRH